MTGFPSARVQFIVLASILIGLACIGVVSSVTADSRPAFDPNPWLEDLDQAQEALASKYANLDWVVVEHETDLTALFADIRARIQSATDAVDARAAFDRLARKIGDGHVRFQWPVTHPPSLSGERCEALGYDPRMQGQPVAALMPGYRTLESASTTEFPAGIVEIAHHRIGVLKIGLFSPQGYPKLCAVALDSLKISPDGPC